MTIPEQADIVERLREDARGGYAYHELSDEAADEIERLRAAFPSLVGVQQTAISPSDPLVTIAGIRQFGLASDGSDLRDLEAAFARLSPVQGEPSDSLLYKSPPEAESVRTMLADQQQPEAK